MSQFGSLYLGHSFSILKASVVYRGVVRPDPIPNSVVKRSIRDDNTSARLCENTPLPGFIKSKKRKLVTMFVKEPIK